ncbi:CHAT domain-containing protein [Collybia nuda]|uniref:CHAT domain-containing protein n=1 Tax=Collybia nuda TaxID=64659 RepID=A0A9P6CFP4_9AGAR|nr:CHAT domain-containing protein [Collybia nuda]
MDDSHSPRAPNQSRTKQVLENVSSFLGMAAIPFKLMRPSSGPAGRDEKIGMDLAERYREHGVLSDLEAAIKHQQAALDATPVWHPYLLDRLSNLAASYSDRYQRLGDLTDIETSLKYQQAAIDTLHPGHHDMPILLSNMSLSFLNRYRRIGNLEDLESAMKHAHTAVDKTPKANIFLPGRKQGLAMTYIDRYERQGNLEDLETATRYIKEALETTPSEHPDLPSHYLGLGMTYTHRYRRLGNTDDLQAAIKYKQTAVDTTPAGHYDLTARQSSLAVAFTDLYQRRRNPEDLQSALKYKLLAVKGTPLGHPDLPARQENLAMSHMDHYSLLGNMEDLEGAIKFHKLSVDGTPPNHPSLPNRHQSLARAHRARYERLRDVDDLKYALKWNLAAVKNAPEGHPEFPGYLRDLSASYMDTYDRLGNMKYLTDALNCDKAAVDATPTDHPEYPSRLHNLSLSYKAAYEHTDDLSDLETALRHELTVVDCTPIGHPSMPGRQHTLANTYRERYKKLKDFSNLEAALKYNNAAVNGTPENHPELPFYHRSLSMSYELLYGVNKNPEDLENALHSANLSSQSITAPSLALWNSAIYWAGLAWRHDNPESVMAYTAAFDILPNLIWIGSSLGTRLDIIIRQGISAAMSSAVSTALHFSQPEKAVEFLEQGISIIHRQMLQLKDPAQQLWEKFPLEAQKLQQISFQLSQSMDETTLSKSTPVEGEATVNYNLLAAERSQLIQKIRKLEGFEDFLMGVPYPKLQDAAREGPVIMINCASTRIDAIIILSPTLPVKSIKLLVSLDDTRAQLGRLQSALKGTNIHTRNENTDRVGRPTNLARPQDIFQNVVTWLWNNVGHPVFKVLYENNITGGRIWWCPSGPFTYLPIHAAAPINSNYVQSYTYTLDALIQSRARRSSNKPGIVTGVAVTEIPYQPTWQKLSSVQKELETVSQALGSHQFSTIINSEASINNAMKAMEKSSLLHLACHGQQDPLDPLKSGLMLYDGRLELRSILSTNLPSAQFVFLSACETAMGDAKLMNEAMHLAGGFIAAGFQGAIGTLWSMSDADGPKVAGAVYRKMFGDDSVPDVTLAAEGLHLAVQNLRKQGAPFHQWIPFIHVGI